MSTAGNRPSDSATAELFEQYRRTGDRRIRNRLVRSNRRRIADRIGVSQMHVSRLLRNAFEQMKQVSLGWNQADQTGAEPDQDPSA